MRLKNPLSQTRYSNISISESTPLTKVRKPFNVANNASDGYRTSCTDC